MINKKTSFVLVVMALLLLLPSFSLSAQEDQRQRDWPNLSRYREANLNIKAPAAEERRVVFMGDSITEVWGRTQPEFFSQKPYFNRGISGQTTPQILLRFRADVVNLKPGAVVILAGINDIAEITGPSTPEMIQDNLASMAEIAVANGIKVVLASVLPVLDFPWKPGMEPADKVIDLNKWIKAYAEKEGHVYLDYYSLLVDENKGLKSEYTKDGVHPNEEGYKLIAPLAEKAIEKAFGAID